MSDKKELDFVITTADRRRVHIEPYYDGSVWLSLSVIGGSAYVPLTMSEAKQVLEALQKVIEGYENAHADA